MTTFAFHGPGQMYTYITFHVCAPSLRWSHTDHTYICTLYITPMWQCHALPAQGTHCYDDAGTPGNNANGKFHLQCTSPAPSMYLHNRVCHISQAATRIMVHTSNNTDTTCVCCDWHIRLTDHHQQAHPDRLWIHQSIVMDNAAAPRPHTPEFVRGCFAA
jgi:hypothetical protein